MLKSIVCNILIGSIVLCMYASPAVAQGVSAGQKIYINTAGINGLKKVPGITRDIAEAILKYKDEHGPFRKTDDLLRVPGITKDVFTRICPHVSPEGFIYCFPECEDEDDEEEEPVVLPSIPPC
jgi:competence ComEA-like helix-hairpin-helix protein